MIAKQKTLILLALFILTTLTITAPALSCIQYAQGGCIRCRNDSHLWKGLCYPKIDGCAQYLNQGKCKTCAIDFTLKDGGCVVSPNKQVTLYTLAYPHNEYIVMRAQQIQSDSLFSQCDNFVRFGQYSHFISRGVRPFLFVGKSLRNQFNSYKIIYLGSGGGLLLCIVDIVQTTQAVLIRSLVTIGATQTVERCLEYSMQMQCSQCQSGYHLQNKVCYPDISGCVSYVGWICIRCAPHALLLENRCISSCRELCDTNKLEVYGWPLRL